MDILVARSPDEIDSAHERLSAARSIGCDTETTGFNSRVGRLLSIQFSDGDFSVLVPLSENVALGRLAEVLADAAVTKIFHNARFDIEFLEDASFAVNNVFDTMIAERVLTRGADQSSSLAETLYRHFAIDLDKSQRSKFSRKWNGNWTDDLVAYALADVAHLPRLMTEQMAWLEKLGLTDEFHRQMAKATSGGRPDGLL